MRLGTKTRYGARAMLELTLNHEIGLVSVREMAARQSVSPKYLEHILASLRSADLVRSVRGARGGHSLTRRPDQVNLREICHVFEGREGFVECTSRPEVCDEAESCAAREIWAKMYAACMATLESTSLEDLARRSKEMGQASAGSNQPPR